MAGSTTPPNILYILSDQHSPRVLGCYGDPVVETPHLDGLASRGVVFDSSYCPSPICVPSRMSMLTGLTPNQNQVWVNSDILSSGIPTFAHSLAAAGYETTLVGRMHSVGPDQLRGYAERLVGDHHSNWPGGGTRRGGVERRGALDGAQGPKRTGASLGSSGPGLSGYEIHDEDVTAAAVAKLRQIGVRRRAGVTDRPFLLSVGYMLPHAPFVAREEDFARYQGRVQPPVVEERFGDDLHPFVRWWRGRTGTDHSDRAQALRARAAYWGLVHRLDHMIGDVLAALQEYGLADDTLVVYSADHGEHAGEHGLWWKHTMYEESARVPTIIAWPRRIPGGQRCTRVVSSLDVTATVLAAAGAQSLPLSPGRDVLPLVDGSPDVDWPDLAFSEYCTGDYDDGGHGEPGGTFTRMVREGDWKLIYYHGHPPQLFNIAEDPHETTDRASDPEFQDVRARLTRLVLDGWDPDLVAERMGVNAQRARIFQGWRAEVEPAEQYVWSMQPEMNYLASPAGATQDREMEVKADRSTR